ncbi:MAG: glycoside hydrolase family 16 protein [Alistipes sp.]|nr:glycoside hydrolase family 16 protein [Alistipes sp.]
MKKIYLISLIVILCGCSGRSAPGTRIETGSGVWELVWNDEFDYTGLPDSTKWSYDTFWNDGGWGNDELQYYTEKDTANAVVRDGKLFITARRFPHGQPEYTSARIVTRGKADWKYGRFEVRVKMPAGRGLWSAVWMLPTGNEYGTWPASGEIDIVESVGYEPGRVVSTVHTENYHHLTGTEKNGEKHAPGFSTQYHVYALEWEPDRITSFVDGEEIFRYDNDGSGYGSWPFDRNFYLTVNLAVGGNWGGKYGVDELIFPASLEVDYIRVYKKIE